MSMLMKLKWSILTGADELGRLLQFKFVNKDGEIIKHYKKCSMWPGVKACLVQLRNYVKWMIYDGTKIDFLRDNWETTQSIKGALNLNDEVSKGCDAKLAEFFNNGMFHISPQLLEWVSNTGFNLDRVYQ